MQAKRMSNIRIRAAAPLFAVLSLVGASGCDDGRLATYPVTGTVLVADKPADGAMVIFCPVDGSEELMKHRPWGVAQPDGKFELMTFEEADGAPAGQYKVIIQWPVKIPPSERNPMGGLGQDRLKGRFMNLEKSQLTATVNEEATDVPPFKLSM